MPFENGVWAEFLRDVQSRTANLAAEFSNAWKDVAAVTAAQSEAFAALENPHSLRARLESLDECFTIRASMLLADPLAVYIQKRPLQRALSAIEEYEAVLGDVLRRLPRVVELTGPALIELAGIDRRPALRLWWSVHRKPRPVRLRETISGHLLSMNLSRAALDGAFQLLLAQAALHLLAPWQTCRRAFLAALTQSEGERVDVEGSRRLWMDAARRLEQRATLLLARYDTWAGSVATEISEALLRNPKPASTSTRANWEKEHHQHTGFWARQQRAVRSVIDLELHLARLARETNVETTASMEAIDTEHAELIQELDNAISWLQQWPRNEESGSFPQPGARLLSPEERLSDWLRRTALKAREELPITIETVEPRQALPGWRKPWRDLEPAKVFLNALATAGEPVLLGGFHEVEEAHRAIVREIERAREVVDFGLETARLGHGESKEFAREAVKNATALLNHQRDTTPDIRGVIEEAAARAQAAVLLECDVALEKNRLGLLAHITRRRSGQAIRQLRALTGRELQAGSRYAWTGFRRANRWALLKIGWIAPPRQPAPPVIRRADLAETLEVQLLSRDLPMIYRRLFRLAPVEDPRFLVGRDAEMAGFADALKCWEMGKGASVIVIGARGSGKTSLINCAASGVFPRCDVVRGQFCERVVTRAQMEAFVRGLLQISLDADVGAALIERRRVVLIEEFERTFLRTVDGFEALRSLLDLMYSTGRSTLWVFSVNESAYRYLDAVVGLGRHFSHRINAMSVSQQDLTNAILQRHGLSGLRLEFAPLPQEDPRVSGIRRFLGLEQDPQSVFLDALYEQSEGIFRSAYELWQGAIERVEGGVVHMRQPLAPNYQSLAAEISLEDCFTMKAILQHGSLTPDELARVLATGREESVRQLERLHLLEVVEPEPASPGIRVRPEAGRLVRETLNRRNLL